ncbi:MAG TPA: hypothetical protein VIL85_12965 [Thermomicrobiales bacterium]|jgi:hypothetical protein
MPRSRIILVHYLLGFLTLGSVLSFATRLEIWPFSPYRMYATVRTEHTVGTTRLYGVVLGPRWTSRSGTAPSGALVDQYSADLTAAGPALQAALDRYEELRFAGRHDGPPLRGIRLYRVAWDLQVDAGNVAQPDRRELLAEVLRAEEP